MNHRACPPREVLRAFAMGDLDDTELDDIDGGRGLARRFQSPSQVVTGVGRRPAHVMGVDEGEGERSPQLQAGTQLTDQVVHLFAGDMGKHRIRHDEVEFGPEFVAAVPMEVNAPVAEPIRKAETELDPVFTTYKKLPYASTATGPGESPTG